MIALYGMDVETKTYKKQYVNSYSKQYMEPTVLENIG